MTTSSEAIIFLPGIKGTTLVNTNRADYDTIWSAIQSHYEDLDLLELSFDENDLGYDVWPQSLIRPGQIEGLVYSEFLRDIKTDKPIYLFNYDWRQNSRHNARRLKQFMDMLRAKSRASEHFSKPIECFHMIAHSHGCNVLRQFSREYGFDDIEHVILVAPPLNGSLDAVDAILTGEGVFPGVRAKVRKLIRTFPGALELLPQYPAAQFAEGGAVDFFNPEHWQANITQSDNTYARKFLQTLAIAKEIKDTEDDWSTLPEEIRKKILIITRDGYETAQSLKVYKSLDKEPTNYVDLENIHFAGHGDSTVPHISSCIWHKEILTIMATDSWRYRDYSHAFILKDERVQKMVRRYLDTEEEFDWSIPGHSIKRVVGMQKYKTEEGLPEWRVELES